MRELGEDFKINYGKGKKENEFDNNGKYPVYGANGIIGKSDDYIFEDSKVAITCRGATCGNVHLTKPKSWITNNSLILENSEKINKKYLKETLIQNSVHAAITGTAQPQITIKKLKTIKYLLPPLPEQEKIAEVLSTVDGAIEKTDKIIEESKLAKKGLMQDLLTKGIGHSEFKEVELGPKKLKVPKNWRVVKIKDLGNVVTGTTPSTAESSNFGNDYPFVTPEDLGEIKNIFTANRGLSERGIKKARPLPSESILVVCIGATIGKIGFSKTKLATNQQINSIVCEDGYFSEYIYYAMNLILPIIKSMAGNTATPIVNKGEFKEFEVLIPPLPEQKEIAEILSSIDEKIKKEKEYKESLKSLKKGLMQDLLTGKVRVNNLINS